MYCSWDMVCDGQTDGRKKSHIEVGALPKNRSSEKGRIEIEEKKIMFM